MSSTPSGRSRSIDEPQLWASHQRRHSNRAGHWGFSSGSGFWEHLFTPSRAPSGGDPRFVLLHFNALAFPAGERLEIDLRYGTDTIDAASGGDAWTRPIDPKGGSIRIRYFGSGPDRRRHARRVRERRADDDGNA
jgi:hypothetical protein